MKILSKNTHANTLTLSLITRISTSLMLSGLLTACGSSTTDDFVLETVAGLLDSEPLETTQNDRVLVETINNQLTDGGSFKNKVATADLQAPENFNFTSHYSLNVDLDIQNTTTDRAYLSICKNFSGDESVGFSIDYKDCVVRSSVSEGMYQGELQLSNTDREFVAEVWLFDQKRSLQFHVKVDDLVDGQWVIRAL